MKNYTVTNAYSGIEDNAGKQDAVFSDAAGFPDYNAGMQNAALANLHIGLDDRIGPQLNVVANSGVGRNLRGRVSSTAAFRPRMQVGSGSGKVQPGLFGKDYTGALRCQVSRRQDAAGSQVAGIESFVFCALQEDQGGFIRHIPPCDLSQ
jgi:hypothetical protein